VTVPAYEVTDPGFSAEAVLDDLELLTDAGESTPDRGGMTAGDG